MEFAIPLSLDQLLIPPVCTGVLFAGMFLNAYMAFKFKSGMYRILTIITFMGFAFDLCESLILGIGSFRRNWEVGVQLYRIEQIIGSFFIFVLPLILGEILILGEAWKKINRIITYLCLVISILITITAFAIPDLFISLETHTTTWKLLESDYARGQEGPLYSIRDMLVFAVVLYSIVCMIVDLRISKRFKFLAYPLIGLSVAIYTAIVDILFVQVGVYYDFFQGMYFSRYVVGLSFYNVMLMAGLTEQFFKVSKDLEVAHKLVTISEEKYRLLFEGTIDLIFSLDEKMNFITANNSMLNFFHKSLEQMKKMNFIDIVYSGKEYDKTMEQQIVNEKMKELVTTGKPVMFKMAFSSSAFNEPQEYNIRFEHIKIDNRMEIIGKASGVSDNTLLNSLESEVQNYSIGNYLTTAEEISLRLVRNLSKFLSHREVMKLRIGLREIIVNAIEHGNLNITFEEKSKAMYSPNAYAEFISLRQRNPENSCKKVKIRYELTAEKVVYDIEDDGDGFDHSGVLQKTNDPDTIEKLLSHGRGLIMAHSIFDSVSFNEKGNRAILVKKLIESQEKQ